MATYWCALVAVSVLYLFVGAHGGVIEAQSLSLPGLGGNILFPEHCYDQLGCFPTKPPWTSPARPVPAPDPPKNINTQLYFYSRNNNNERYTPQMWPLPSMKGSDFDPKREKTIFISHGYVETGNKSWPHDMMNQLLRKYDANVFIVDWGSGAFKINYFRAVSNTRIVGAEIARFIRYLRNEYDLDLNKVHLIGHSLGSHIVSYAAKEFNGEINQISALDPAQPGFEGTPENVRLTKSDAKFVQAIHTNARFFVPNGGFGMIRPVGDVDIYVNGGLSQPMCKPGTVTVVEFDKLATLPLDAVYNLGFACHHQMSVQYFISSINSQCKLWAFRVHAPTAIFNAITKGALQPIVSGLKECNAESCTVLGPDAKDFVARGVFATTTTDRAPYCDTSMHPCYDEKLTSQVVGAANTCNDKDFQPTIS